LDLAGQDFPGGAKTFQGTSQLTLHPTISFDSGWRSPA